MELQGHQGHGVKDTTFNFTRQDVSVFCPSGPAQRLNILCGLAGPLWGISSSYFEDVFSPYSARLLIFDQALTSGRTAIALLIGNVSYPFRPPGIKPCLQLTLSICKPSLLCPPSTLLSFILRQPKSTASWFSWHRNILRSVRDQRSFLFSPSMGSI
jgi:hypothetical protein